jgi:hypothetical protein
MYWGRRRIHAGLWMQSLKERDFLEHLSIDWRVVLKLIWNRMEGCGLDLVGSG